MKPIIYMADGTVQDLYSELRRVANFYDILDLWKSLEDQIREGVPDQSEIEYLIQEIEIISE